MARSDFLLNLYAQAKQIERLLSSKGGTWLTGVATKGQNEKGKRLADDRIYEILCYFSLIADLSKKQKLEYISGKGGTGFRLPYGPGDKENFTFFRFKWNQEIYDICPGTHVFSKYKKKSKEHPDISLQYKRNNTDKTPGDPIAIWDAKCYNDPLDKDPFFYLNTWLMVLGLKHFLEHRILSDVMPRAFQANALITNAESNSIKDDYEELFFESGFSAVYEYDGSNPDCEPSPSVDEHRNHRKKQKG